jgi:hypothetical protein
LCGNIAMSLGTIRQISHFKRSYFPPRSHPSAERPGSSPAVSSGSKCEIIALSRCFPLCCQTQTLLYAVGTSRLYHEPPFQPVYAVGFDALKMYRLALKKYLPASLRRSNSLCHSFRSSAEISFLRATKSRISRTSPLL